MTKRIVYQVDSFTKERFKGNPAGVVLNADGLTDEQMLMIARELNNSETAFLFSSDGSDCDGIIRYFTPKVEVPTCGHATIAAMYAKASEEHLLPCVLRYKTRIGVLPFEIIYEEDDIQVIMTQGKFDLSPELNFEIKEEILNSLGLKNSDLEENCPIQIASTGHSKFMIGIKEKDKLNSLNPDFKRLALLSEKLKCNGYFVFTFETNNNDILTLGRMFAPIVGINEDPVTGNANGPLGGYLIKNKICVPQNKYFEFTGRQGEKINRPGEIKVKVQIENENSMIIKIQGKAVIIFRTEIEL